MNENKTYVDYVYDIVKDECEHMDAIYHEYIVKLVGTHGLFALLNNRLLETCSVVAGKQLYTLIEKGEKNV